MSNETQQSDMSIERALRPSIQGAIIKSMRDTQSRRLIGADCNNGVRKRDNECISVNVRSNFNVRFIRKDKLP